MKELDEKLCEGGVDKYNTRGGQATDGASPALVDEEYEYDGEEDENPWDSEDEELASALEWADLRDGKGHRWVTQLGG